MADHHDIAGFDDDATLAADRAAFVVLKGFNQLAIVKKIIERKGNKAFGLTSVTNVTERRYSSGLVALTPLDIEALDDDALRNHVEYTEPFEVDVLGGRLAITSGFRFVVLDLASGGTSEFTNDWMSYLHTIEFSDNGTSILVAATGLDTILEVDLGSGDVVWDWNAWNHGINYVALSNSYLARDRDQAKLLAEEYPDAEVQLIEDPLTLPREGLATHHSPMNLNGAHYGRNGQILATGYHRPEVFVIERDGSHERYDLGLSNPHSFRPLDDGYMVADTGGGRLLLLDERFEVASIVELSRMPADAEKKAGFGEWLQTVSPMRDPGMFTAVDALRDGVHIIDVVNRRRRFISNPPEWTIQAVIEAPADTGRFATDHG